ncbi:hypothetical protein N5P37_008706 [Trichoderma harzianum]|uniref:Zn(2)-C6 fungal-type domain-containing protein n=1 Tax=Trichoderma harzianum CBS 226.95 TaxID=983964 RepID=A0A2T4A7A5_TRIHA|nr:hypothetical protein M431DRAFT_90752 [Trichoderma harzianum CBS 226.95]KAK0758309.1 hypothetical protein N5P37_008706 [Trichoderma harzianum]PKK43641.1 hypothetical protein CI102_11348 [Trichoderma harzianum]PTB52952.1 hypothetical protein M431DRAFT_90752 [Trichoderma harzianum CBS 226.95]
MAHQETESPNRVQKKRARTGCLRCRTRRRKCDEHKPRCQRCIDAEAECVYGPRLSFLQKNAFTLSSNSRNDTSPRKLGGPPKYSKVQFVDNRSAQQKEAGRNEESQISIPSPLSVERESNDAYNDSPPNNNPAATPSTSIEEQQGLYLGSDNLYHDYGGNFEKDQDAQAQNDATSHLNGDSQDRDIGGIRQGDSYEIALDVLMTLGTGDPGVDIDTPTPIAPVLKDIEEINLSSPPSILKSIDDIGPISAQAANQVSRGRTIELLRHYRYKIAPWLDMCDMGQTFGLVIPHLAMRSGMLFDALLKLCATSYSATFYSSTSTNSPTSDSSHLVYPIEYHLEHAKMWEVKLWSVLTAAEGFLVDPPKSWDNALAGNNFLHIVYTQMAENSPFRVLNECMFWLLARFSVSIALLKATTSTINSSLLRNLLESSPGKGRKSGHISLHFAHEPLVLCTEVLDFSFGDEEVARSLNAEPTKPRAVRWKSIVDNLSDWYTNRPSTFRPVIEISNDEFSFPIVYFTSGAATFANQLYHTAMMLILAHKPRTLQLDQRRSSSLSQLWHAQRICGIAINNNRGECWDPCLLTSFYLAAQRMTHESQQREILLGFKHISSLGWRTDGFIERLNQDWHTSGLLG